MKFRSSALVMCSSCQNHVKVQEHTENCPFCEASLTSRQVEPFVPNKRKMGVLGASLVGVMALAYCATPPAPAYGIPAENLQEQAAEQVMDGGTQDSPPAPAYGVPAPTDGGDTENSAPDSIPAPAYGVPAPTDGGTQD